MKQLGNKPVQTGAKVSFKEKLTGFWSKTYNLLFHEDVYCRIGGYLIFGFLLFAVTWACFAFFVKKPNLLFDSFMVQKFFKPEILSTVGPWGEKTFGATWNMFGKEIKVANAFAVWGNVTILTIKFFLNHLALVFGFIFLMNFFKIGRWNLGVLYFAMFTLMWGLVVGTNSMSYPVGANIVLGPVVLFARYGLWVWFSYMLLVVSTTQFAWLVAPSWLNWGWNKERKFLAFSFTPEQREVFIYGLLFLLASSFAEARLFVHYNLTF